MEVNMKKLTTYILSLALVAVMATPSFGQGNIDKVAQTGLQFLKVDMSARSAAMGGAYTMLGNDAGTVFTNPAGLIYMDSQFDFVATRTNWIADISYNAAAVAGNFGNVGTFALSFINSDYGEIAGTQVAATEEGYRDTGNLDFGSTAIGLSYARALNNKFTVGGTVKWAQQDLGRSELSSGEVVDNMTSGFAVDFGSIFYPGYIPSLRLGMNIRNFSQQFKYQEEPFDLPLTFRIGVAVDAFDFAGGSELNSLMVSVDALHPRDYTERVHVGTEYTYNNLLSLRAGYKTNYDQEGLSLGFGINYGIAGMDLKVDYAYSAMNIFSGVNRISVGAAF